MQNVKAGDVIGRYALVREVSKGFPGALWLLNFQHEGQRMLALGRIVQFTQAIADSTWASLTESAWDAMEVNHECIASAADVVFEAQRLLTVYDYSEGEPLTVLDRLKTVQNAPFPAAVALRIVVDLLDALEALHTTSLQLGASGAYGGVGPDSLLVGTDGCTRLLDIYVGGAASEQAELRMLPERVRYVAPEQFAEELVDARADVYAAGCVLWELLANRRLHIGAPQAVERRVRLGQLPPLRPAGPLSQGVIDAVEKALKPDRQHRFESAAAMATQLRAVAEDIAERSVVAGFVAKLANRQLETRRKVTEQSTIARLRDLLDSRPPPRATRRSVAPPRPLAASALAATAPGIGAADAPPAVAVPVSPKRTLLGLQAPLIPEFQETEPPIEKTPPGASTDRGPDSDGPTAAMSHRLLATMVSDSQATQGADSVTAPGAAVGVPRRGWLNQGTLLGMPAPPAAAEFVKSLAQPASEAASLPSYGDSPPVPMPAAPPEVSKRRLSNPPPKPGGRPFTDNPGARLSSHESAEGVQAAAVRPSFPEAPALPLPALKKNWQPLIWAILGSCITLALVIVVLLIRDADDSAAAVSATQAVPAAVPAPAAAPDPSEQEPHPAAAQATATPPEEPGEVDSPAEDEIADEPEPAIDKPAAPARVAPPKKRRTTKKTPKKFVPDGL